MEIEIQMVKQEHHRNHEYSTALGHLYFEINRCDSFVDDMKDEPRAEWVIDALEETARDRREFVDKVDQITAAKAAMPRLEFLDRNCTTHLGF